jgi:hypothetical protein
MVKGSRHELRLARERAQGRREAIQGQHGGRVAVDLASPKSTLAPPSTVRGNDSPSDLAGEVARGGRGKRGSPGELRGDAHVEKLKTAHLSGAWHPGQAFKNLGDWFPSITGVRQRGLRQALPRGGRALREDAKMLDDIIFFPDLTLLFVLLQPDIAVEFVGDLEGLAD